MSGNITAIQHNHAGSLMLKDTQTRDRHLFMGTYLWAPKKKGTRRKRGRFYLIDEC